MVWKKESALLNRNFPTDVLSRNSNSGRRYFWSFFNPNGRALAEIAGLVEANKDSPGD